jgi:hypothetical protein
MGNEKGKDMIIMKRMKEINGKNIQQCLQVFSALYAGKNFLQMRREYSI